MRPRLTKLCHLLALVALAVCAGVPIAAYMDKISFAQYLRWFNLASLLWFLTAPLWIVPGLFGKKWEEAGRLAKLRQRHRE
jgi:hypothetical protein